VYLGLSFPLDIYVFPMTKKTDDQFSEKEAAARRDAVIKRMIAMPPKPHSEMKVGKKAKKKKRAKKKVVTE
jgi:hypothetical protein